MPDETSDIPEPKIVLRHPIFKDVTQQVTAEDQPAWVAQGWLAPDETPGTPTEQPLRARVLVGNEENKED